MRTAAVSCVVMLVLSVVAVAATRTFVDSTGQHKIEAEFVGFSNGQVQLKKQDGAVIKVKISRLSSNDQRWVRAELKRRRDEATATDNGQRSSSSSMHGDWAQWRGPNRDGLSMETGLLDSWNGSSPPIVWSVRGAGSGYSSVAVSADKIVTMGKRGGSEELVAFKREDGSLLWNVRVGSGSDCNCTPTIDGDLVFGLGREGDLVCADVNSGDVKWRKNFLRDFGGRMMSGWGYSESPLVDGDRLLVTPGGDQAIMAALNKRTGETIWTTPMPRSGGAGYSSIVISNGGGVKQYVTLVGRGLIGVDAQDGRLLWHYPKIANSTANVPTPIVSGNYVFGSSGYEDGGSALLELSKNGRAVSYREVYYKSNNELQNHHGGMILIGDYIYMGHGHNKGLPTCVELKTGRSMWDRARGAGSGSAAIIAADGHLYFRYENGTMALIEANPRQYNLKGTFRIASVNGKSWPHPVVAGKKLYLRDQDQLHCYDIARD